LYIVGMCASTGQERRTKTVTITNTIAKQNYVYMSHTSDIFTDSNTNSCKFIDHGTIFHGKIGTSRASGLRHNGYNESCTYNDHIIVTNLHFS